MAKQTGKDGSVYVDAVQLKVSDWSLSLKTDIHDVTTTEGNGAKEKIGGLLEGSGTVSSFWDVDSHPTDNPPNLQPGTSVVLKLHLGAVADGKFFTFSAIVEELSIESGVASAIGYNFTFQSTGLITYPT